MASSWSSSTRPSRTKRARSQRGEDRPQRISDRGHEAPREQTERPASVQERRRVGQELAGAHHPGERLGPPVGRSPPVGVLGGGHVGGHPIDHVPRRPPCPRGRAAGNGPPARRVRPATGPARHGAGPPERWGRARRRRSSHVRSCRPHHAPAPAAAPKGSEPYPGHASTGSSSRTTGAQRAITASAGTGSRDISGTAGPPCTSRRRSAPSVPSRSRMSSRKSRAAHLELLGVSWWWLIAPSANAAVRGLAGRQLPRTGHDQGDQGKLRPGGGREAGDDGQDRSAGGT